MDVPDLARESVLEIQVNASLQGHDLGPFLEIEHGRGWQATCRRCGQTAYVRDDGLQYSLLHDTCPNQSISDFLPF
jgi:hypothetical protein